MKYELTNAQKRILYIDDLYANSSISNIGGICYVPGNVNYEILKESINIFVKSNEIFNFRFKNDQGQVYQEIVDYKCSQIEFIDFTNNKNKFDNWYQEFMNESISIYNDYLYKFTIFKLDEKTSGYIVKIHHIISDGYSIAILFSQIAENYDNLLKIRENTIITTPYSEFIKLENEYLKSEKFFEDKKFWNEKFSNLNENFLYKEKYNCMGKSFKYTIPMEITNKLNKLLNENKITKNTFFIALLYLYLYKKTGDKDIVIGSPFYNRTNKKLKHSIGMFVSTIPVRFKINNEINFKDFIKELNIQLRSYYRHQKYPYNLLINDLKLPQNGFDGLFKIIFNYYNESFRYPMNHGETHAEEITSKQVTFPLNLILREFIKSNLELEFQYRIDEFDGEEINIMCNCIMNMIVQIVDNIDISIKDIEMISPFEKELILAKFNDAKYIDNIDQYTICDFFEKVVKKYPNNLAVVYNGKSLSYKSLNNRANYLAKILRDKGINKKSVVGIISEKSLESIVGLLAILKAGGVYLPIDSDYPKERVIYMLKDSNAQLLLTNTDYELDYNIEKLKVTNEELYLGNEIGLGNSGDDLAYIMYTSGSTGKPKGVKVTNKGVIRLVIEPNYINLKSGDKMAQSGSMVFDAATFEIWGALLNGMTLVVLDKQVVLDSAQLKRTFEETKINVCWITSPLFNQLCETDAETFNGLDYLITGGDIVSPKYIAKLQKINKNINIICGYGPTENTTFTTYFKIPNDWDENEIIPIGQAISGTKVYVVDPDNNLQPIGVEGELCTSGQGLAKGYVNNLELTQKSFVDNPFDSMKSKMYMTGDLGKFMPDGKIHFLGRKDNQVKIRGFRIEPGEIEIQLINQNNINEAVVLVKTNSNAEKYICAFITASEEINIPKLKKNMSRDLPEYMIPTIIFQIDKMPLNHNGKIDKGSLPEPQYIISSNNYVEASNEIQQSLVDIWKQILGVERIGINENFFDIGGNSLLVMRMHAEIEKKLKKKIAVTDIFAYPTIEKISEFIGKCIDIKDKKIGIEYINFPEEYFNTFDSGCEIGSVNFKIDGKLFDGIIQEGNKLKVEPSYVLFTIYIYLISKVSERNKFNVQYATKKLACSLNIDLSSISTFDELIGNVSKKLKLQSQLDLFAYDEVAAALQEADEFSIIPLFCSKYNVTSKYQLIKSHNIVFVVDEYNSFINCTCYYNSKKLKREKVMELVNFYLYLSDILLKGNIEESSEE